MIAAWLLIGIGVGITGPLYAQISGRVVANGGPPAVPAWVAVHCAGGATWDWAGYTDKRGEFLSAAPQGYANLSGDYDYGYCRIVATLPGFQRGVAETGTFISRT